MRTTLTLDDDVAAALKKAAYSTGRSFKAAVNETLRAGLAAIETPPRPRRYRVKPASLGGVLPGVDLDKALQLADALQDRCQTFSSAVARMLRGRLSAPSSLARERRTEA